MEIRAKIGLISPVESLTEKVFHKYAPEDIDIRTTRIAMRGRTTATVGLFIDKMEAAAKVFEDHRQDIILFGCAGASSMGEKGIDAACSARITRASGCPGTTTTTATIEALEAFGAKRVILLSPYPEDVAGFTIRYFGFYGIEIFRSVRLEGHGQENISSETVYAQAKLLETAGADALLISCMAIDTMDIIDRLEAELGIPVVTSHQASLWSVLRRTGIDDKLPGMGRLFIQH